MNTTENNKPGISSQVWSTAGGVIIVTIIIVTIICALWHVNHAAPAVKDKQGNTVLDYARRDGHTNIVESPKTCSVGFAEIEGAFGLTLGQTFDVNHRIPVKRLVTSHAENALEYKYEFTAENLVPGFTTCFFAITPKTHRIHTIEAVGPPFGYASIDNINVIIAALAKKYGGKPDRDEKDLYLALGGVALAQEYGGKLDSETIYYRRKANNRSILFRASRDNNDVEISYSDDSLTTTARTEQEELDRERKELDMAEEASRQRELDGKAKELGKSGL